MPSHYDDHYEDNTQEWDTIILNSDHKLDRIGENGIKTNNMNEMYDYKSLPLNRKIMLGRQKSKYTSNQLASILRISHKEYEDIENNLRVPSKQCLNKLRKFIDI